MPSAIKPLITGGSGYLGRAVATFFDKPILVDRHNDFNDYRLIEVDLLDYNRLKYIVTKSKPSVIIHLAASKSVPESVSKPTSYYQNNVAGSLNLIKICEDLSIPLVFASTAAVYLDETPYSDSKLFVEKVISKSSVPYRTLRYFNMGGLIEPPTARQKGNVFDIIRSCVNTNTPFTLNSNSLPRDYTHILDVARVTAEAVAEVVAEGGSKTQDVLSGRTASLYELIAAYKENGVEVPVVPSNTLVETSTPIPNNPYQFTPKYSLEDIVKSEIKHGLTGSQYS